MIYPFCLRLIKKTDAQLNKRYVNNDDLTIMAIMKSMITTVIILKSMMIKMIISDNNDNETMNAQISLHIYMKGF